MVDWDSLTELRIDGAAFAKLIHALLGLYLYEWFLSFPFDWDFISGKKRFRWPLIFYFGNRYLLLSSLVGIVIALDTTTKINCQSLYTFNQITGNAAVGLASVNLSIRTMAVWSQNKYLVTLLIILIMGHWSLILQGVLLNATWADGVGCTITKTNKTVLAATFIYSMCFDLIVLSLNAYKLLGVGSEHRFTLGSSRIAKMIFEDGLIFFIIAFFANLVATVFMVLGLNAIMTVIFNVPAAVASTIVSCRVVRRLINFTSCRPGVYNTNSTTNINFRSEQNTKQVTAITTVGTTQKSGTHIQDNDDIEANPVNTGAHSATDLHFEAKVAPL